MKPEVRAAFPTFSATFEGRVHWLYLDILGLVTTGIGNLVDPISYATELPWLAPNGYTAPQTVIREQWATVKAHTELAQQGYRAAEKFTTIRLTDAAIDALVLGKLTDNERILKQRFPGLEDWPAEAQLALFSMAWALGPSFPKTWPKFAAACTRMDWGRAADECYIPDANNPGLAPRNAEDKRLFLAAARPSGDPPPMSAAVVRAIQVALNRRGAAPTLAEDGIWGQRTQAAADAYRAAHGLPAGQGPTVDLAKALGIF